MSTAIKCVKILFISFSLFICSCSPSDDNDIYLNSSEIPASGTQPSTTNVGAVNTQTNNENNTRFEYYKQLNISNVSSDFLSDEKFLKMPAGFHYLSEGKFLVIPTLYSKYPTLPILIFEENNNSLSLTSYVDSQIEMPRDIKNLSSDKIVIADTGFELIDEDWPHSSVWVFNHITKEIQKINPDKKFYHSIGVSDLNNDNSLDIISMNMSSRFAPWGGDGHIETYLNSGSGQFERINKFKDEDGGALNMWHDYLSGAIIVDDFFGDSRPEIIKMQYTYGDWDINPYSFLVYHQNNDNLYEVLNINEEIGLFDSNGRLGASYAISLDLNSDNHNDLIVFYENANNEQAVESFLNNGVDGFVHNQTIIENYIDELYYREGVVDDIDNDGDMDLILHGWAFSANNVVNEQLLLNNYIYINNNGTFTKSSPDDFNHLEYSYDDYPNLEWMRYVPSEKSFYILGGRGSGIIEIGKISLNKYN